MSFLAANGNDVVGAVWVISLFCWVGLDSLEFWTLVLCCVYNDDCVFTRSYAGMMWHVIYPLNVFFFKNKKIKKCLALSASRLEFKRILFIPFKRLLFYFNATFSHSVAPYYSTCLQNISCCDSFLEKAT